MHGVGLSPGRAVRRLEEGPLPDPLHLHWRERVDVPHIPGRNDDAPRLRRLQRCGVRELFLEAVYGGVHSVIDVPPGGEAFTLTLLDARDENMTVKSVVEGKRT